MTNWDAQNIESATFLQGLQVGQLIYTSFIRSGFVLLKSADVPIEVQQVFVSQYVQTHWDTYSPPKSGYQAAFIHQFALTTPGTLFGWLYHDGQDEFKRSDVPYFLAYYLPNKLEAVRLSQILACLQQGPVEWIERYRHPPSELLPLSLGNTQSYNAARQGVELPTKLRVESYRTLEFQTLLHWFYETPDLQEQSLKSQILPPILNPSLNLELNASPKQSLGGSTMNIDNLAVILNQLVAKPGIQGAALVSSEGQAIVAPIGIDENTAGILAGNMLCLLKGIQEELFWQDIEIVSVRSDQGHLILKGCGIDLYLLIKSDKVPVGLLEGEISRAIEKLQVELQTVFNADEGLASPAPQVEHLLLPEPLFAPAPENLSHLPTLPADAEVTYRGRRVGS